MKLTSIQVREDTRKLLASRKTHPGESYDSVIRKVLESDSIPGMEEMFRIGDNMSQKRSYTAKEIVGITHQLRRRR